MNITEFTAFVETNYEPRFRNSIFLQKVIATEQNVKQEVHDYLDVLVKQEADAAQLMVDEYDRRALEVSDDLKKLAAPPPTPEDVKMEWSAPPDLKANPPPPHEEYPIKTRQFGK